MRSDDIDQKEMTRLGRATEKAEAKQLTEPRPDTEWLDQFSIDEEREKQRLAQEKKKQVAEEKEKRQAQEKKKRVAEEKSLTYPLAVIPGESNQQREERLTRWEAAAAAQDHRPGAGVLEPSREFWNRQLCRFAAQFVKPLSALCVCPQGSFVWVL
jgi:hypothetical protein